MKCIWPSVYTVSCEVVYSYRIPHFRALKCLKCLVKSPSIVQHKEILLISVFCIFFMPDSTQLQTWRLSAAVYIDNKNDFTVCFHNNRHSHQLKYTMSTDPSAFHYRPLRFLSRSQNAFNSMQFTTLSDAFAAHNVYWYFIYFPVHISLSFTNEMYCLFSIIHSLVQSQICTVCLELLSESLDRSDLLVFLDVDLKIDIMVK